MPRVSNVFTLIIHKNIILAHLRHTYVWICLLVAWPLPSYHVFSLSHLGVRVFPAAIRFSSLLFCSDFRLFFSAISIAFPGGQAVCPCSSYMSGACQCTPLNSYEAVWLACVVSVGPHPAHNAVGSGPATYPIGTVGTWKARHWIVEVISWVAGLRLKVHFDDIQLVGPILGGYVPIPVQTEVMSGFRPNQDSRNDNSGSNSPHYCRIRKFREENLLQGAHWTL